MGYKLRANTRTYRQNRLRLIKVSFILAFTFMLVLPCLYPDTNAHITTDTLLAGAGAAHGTTSNPDQEVLDPVLKTTLGNAEDDDLIEIIVQFEDKVTHAHLARLNSLHFSIKKCFSVIPAVYAVGLKSSVLALSGYDDVYWIEYNERLMYFMDESTTTINATSVWNTKIKELSGRDGKPIDGMGVTVVDLDSGVDAGHPDLDYRKKVIMNLKSDLDLTYIEAENTDTSSGHGTHVAGTIAGNGDASGGARKGVASGARLIGISTGEAVMIINALGALEWVYEHSRPGANPFNIRVVSNSWGSSGEYNPQDSIAQVSRKLTYDNNVVVVFAAGNAGSENHDGSEVTTNPYSLEPGVISVAATAREGGSLATFSSRGIAGDNFTWPDVGAPGVKIWATEARKTLISAMRKQDPEDAVDGYYMAISGTSMATPHVSGLVALLFQACPALGVSEVHDDHNGTDQEYWANPETRMHEAELILKLTADYIAPDNLPLDDNSDNGVPDEFGTGVNTQRYDYAQGYGQVNAEKAVALALTLNELRSEDPETTVTVLDAYRYYEKITTTELVSEKTDTLSTSWHGDWGHLNTGDSSSLFTTQPRYVYIPNETKKIVLDLVYNAFDINEKQIASLALTIDYDNDGTVDWTGSLQPAVRGQKYDELEITGKMQSNLGKLWSFNIVGRGVGSPLTWFPHGLDDIINNEFRELLIEYSVSVRLILSISDNSTVFVPPQDLHARVGQLQFSAPSAEYSSGTIEMQQRYYDLKLVYWEEPHGAAEKRAKFPLWMIGLIVLLILIVGGWYYIKKKKLKG